MFQQIFKSITVALLMVIAAFSVVTVTPAFAQSDLVPGQEVICKDSKCPIIGTQRVNNINQNGLVQIIINVARFLTFIGVGLAVLFMVWGGIKYITSNGSEDAGKGKEILINATIGLVISIVAFTVVTVLANILTGNIAENIIR